MSKDVARPLKSGKDAKIHRAWFTMIGCLMIMGGGTGLLMSCSGLFYVPITADWGIGVGDLSIWTSFRTGSSVLILPFGGFILDSKWGHKFAIFGAALCCATLIAASRFTAVWQFCVMGACQGIGRGVFNNLYVPVIITHWFKKKTGTALGVASAGSGFASMIFNPILAAAITKWGWHTAYLVYAFFFFIMCVLPLLTWVRKTPQQVGWLPYGVDSEEELAQMEKEAVLAGAKQKEDGSAPTSINWPVYIMIIISAALSSSTVDYYQFFASLATGLGFSLLFGATMTSCASFGNIGYKFVLGLFSDRFGAFTAAQIGMGSALLCALIHYLLGASIPGWVLLTSAVLWGGSPAMANLMLPMMTREIAPPEKYSRMYSFVIMAYFGMTVWSHPQMGRLYDKAGDYHLVQIMIFGFYIPLMVILTIINLMIKKDKKKRAAEQAAAASAAE